MFGQIKRMTGSSVMCVEFEMMEGGSQVHEKVC